ncbi:hypothetical protein SDC9_50673 [bioreactor metagenome]|uniref:Uncharacterized protein n=1 Tax=bioreactor metagenome TaxID=1076179 RepID=A0A644WKH7_9ZZZZ
MRTPIPVKISPTAQSVNPANKEPVNENPLIIIIMETNNADMKLPAKLIAIEAVMAAFLPFPFP